jgi:ABC-type sugar transport system ATPase subunit
VSDALLLDEPYAGLDAGLRRSLTEFVDVREVPAVLVAHELAEAQAFADRLAIIDRGCLLQIGAPGEVVLRPASRRVAELVGYLGFVPAPGRPDAIAGVHPERVAVGADPGRGVVLTGMVTGCRPSGAGWEADLAIGATTVTCRLPERLAEVGGQLIVTAIDPPWFGPDGTAVGRPDAAGVPRKPSDPEQGGT